MACEIMLMAIGLRSCEVLRRQPLFSPAERFESEVSVPCLSTEGSAGDTVIDGELVALGPDGRPDFNLLQNFPSAESRIIYYAFDILIHQPERLTGLPLSERRAVLSSVIQPGEHVALSQVLHRSAAEMLRFIKSHGL
jgi:ATP-dependent DNA ligase